MGDSIRKAVLFQLTFPDNDDTPLLSLQLPPYILVPFLIPPHFRHPEIGVGLGDSVMLASLMSMPETTVHEDDSSVLGKNNIRRARKSAVVYPITKTLSPKSMTQLHLRLRIGGVDLRHTVMPLLWCERIGHCSILILLQR